MFAGVLDLAEHEKLLGDRGLGGAAMAEIRRDRLLETGFVLRDRGAQPRQPVETLAQRRGRLRPRQLEHVTKGGVEAALARDF